ncbi:MAG TPA: YraN family protein [Thermomicrobiales bacterium]|nr:YraN family protein [Thermomicrobiales bacterium]
MPDPSIRKRRGQTGESHARAWLEGHGYRRVASNWHCRSGELDLVMIDGTELVFVEVKTRTGERAGRASEAVSRDKRRKIPVSAEWFIATRPACQDMIWRCDIAAVTINPDTGTAHIDHFENAVVSG